MSKKYKRVGEPLSIRRTYRELEDSNILINERGDLYFWVGNDLKKVYKNADESYLTYLDPDNHYYLTEEIKETVQPYTLVTYPLNNSGKIRLRLWNEKIHSYIEHVSFAGVAIRSLGFYDWITLAKEYEWLENDGSVRPFGVEV